MQRDIEGESRIAPAERPRDEREMGGAADGEELGTPLDDAEDEGLEEAQSGLEWCRKSAREDDRRHRGEHRGLEQ